MPLTSTESAAAATVPAVTPMAPRAPVMIQAVRLFMIVLLT
ncbi:hypothetical protein [Pseudactinotalea terrae]|nr:hypothetical protein [Pseudactinotalea terrae]